MKYLIQEVNGKGRVWVAKSSDPAVLEDMQRRRAARGIKTFIKRSPK